ncbi:hypothetical protein AB2L27_19875 [Kineococcus sp. LSe6-4]|uniref:Uncharacterized protein n=1 Tax=Kineococcus halophytocola TaxID=3234027 RepID=A0ABV4H6Q8_9ACTN
MGHAVNGKDDRLAGFGAIEVVGQRDARRLGHGLHDVGPVP